MYSSSIIKSNVMLSQPNFPYQMCTSVKVVSLHCILREMRRYFPLLLAFQLLKFTSASPSRLGPLNAVMSSVYEGFTAEKCIDGEEGGWDPGHSDEENMCHTLPEPFPWLALDFGSTVNVTRVVLVNRFAAGGDKAQGISVFVANNLPTSSEELFTNGSLLGVFVGPATEKQKIQVRATRAVALQGRYLIVQMDNGRENPMHLKEVFVFGQGGWFY